MRELGKKAIIAGKTFSFEAVVEHAAGEGAIVLCRNESGEPRKPSSEGRLRAPLRESRGGC